MKKLILTLALILLPFVTAFAQIGPEGEPDITAPAPEVRCDSLANFSEFVDCGVKMIINPLIYLIMALALLYFLIGVFKYIRETDAKRAEAAKMILWGIIGLFVMVSVWGLVNVVAGTFPLSNNTMPEVKFPTP